MVFGKKSVKSGQGEIVSSFYIEDIKADEIVKLSVLNIRSGISEHFITVN